MFGRASSDKRQEGRFPRFLASPEVCEALQVALALVLLFGGVLVLSGCQTEPIKPIVQTVTVDRPVQVLCKIPPVDQPAWETERANAADPVLVSRAIRAELEQSRAHIVSLEAAARACQ